MQNAPKCYLPNSRKGRDVNFHDRGPETLKCLYDESEDNNNFTMHSESIGPKSLDSLSPRRLSNYSSAVDPRTTSLEDVPRLILTRSNSQEQTPLRTHTPVEYMSDSIHKSLADLQLGGSSYSVAESPVPVLQSSAVSEADDMASAHSAHPSRKASRSLRLFESSTSNNLETGNSTNTALHNVSSPLESVSERLSKSGSPSVGAQHDLDEVISEKDTSLSRRSSRGRSSAPKRRKDSGSSKTTATYIPHNPSKKSSQHLPLLPDASFELERSVSRSYQSPASTPRSSVSSVSSSPPEDHPFFHWNVDYPVTVRLEPFKHQVGGHTAFFRFSKRAVCKPLTRNENTFYETIEACHPELLPFIPKYIGVLNVTHTITKTEENDSTTEYVNTESSSKTPAPHKHTFNSCYQKKDYGYIPEVSVEQNRHIFPEWMLPDKRSHSYGSPKSLHHKSSSAGERPVSPTFVADIPPKTPWGTTLINRKLREEVLREVFAPKHARRRLGTRFHSRSSHRPSVFRDNSVAFGQLDNGNTSSRARDKDADPNKSLSCSVEDKHYDLHSAVAEENEEVDEELLNVPSNNQGKSYRRFSSDAVWEEPESNEFPRVSGTMEDYDSRESTGHTIKELRSTPNSHGTVPDDSIFAMDNEENSELPPPLEPAEIGDPFRSVNDPRRVLSLPHMASADEDHRIPASDNQNNNNNDANALAENSESQHSTQIERYIVIEDLTSGMKRPCVLDVKMGTRQYGIMATEKKKASQTKKCAMTTSRVLGVRICGMQVWHPWLQSYTFEDKYVGRDIKAGEEFQHALMRYLGKTDDDEDNSHLLVHHIPTIIRKLEQLEQIVRFLKGSRLYASSLLFLYDGEPPPSDKSSKEKVKPREIDIRIVDFANCVFAEDKELLAKATCPPQHKDTYDRGYVRGLRTLRLYFLKIWKEAKGMQIAERGYEDSLSNAYDELGGLMSYSNDDDSCGETST
ncbi:inositol polyphosphate kinase Kcs1 [Schizosaccharomyces pombe]|uniref:Uncharacterized inositol polyphosphate kinase C970.08 n=1 Tax=Schizosaccharomyces pombe (strain 972 / ATCC 24843) TaxID=284812 RepID=YCZ8_SCHPO|nr:putative inositol polyphosphate kinase [Schizosaccharomyces pombe]O74561.1 RecName: Full=Uncharacterized inositol polyphosphate kinase C970.08 [Schizosaccharomyces pombe 972h-]CAA20701.1 inositol polyphosphate kinase (predicted) [Schizosaccharomyces pombe]|eukprot:NP_587847.1 putative inositol polyphosphate kinase [Schizosaccharomyces pombe]